MESGARPPSVGRAPHEVSDVSSGSDSLTGDDYARLLYCARVECLL